MDAARAQRKAEAVAGHDGTTFFDVYTVLLVAALSYAATALALPRADAAGRGTAWGWAGWLVEFLGTAGPPCVATLWPDSVAVWLAILAAIVFQAKAEFPAWEAQPPAGFEGPRLRFVSAVRGILLLLTCFNILAVDFPAYPTHHMKTEAYGYSLMDVGVGLMCLVNGLVAGGRGGTGTGAGSRFRITLAACGPLVLLGLARLATVKTSGYQEHVTEYGVHWNFFFTLAIVMLAGSVLQRVTAGWWDTWRRTAILGAGIMAAHEIALQRFGLAAYVLSPERDGLLGMNKEGIVSLPGYIGAYTLFQAIGVVLREPRTTCQQWYALAFDLGRAVLGSALALYVLVEGMGIAPSRRLCNATYILYVLICLLTVALATLLTDIKVPSRSNRILSALSKNMLPVFLLANLLTGLVNLAVETEAASYPMTGAILVAYLALLSLAATSCEHRSLKWW